MRSRTRHSGRRPPTSAATRRRLRNISDDHHTVEDVGIAIGQALRPARSATRKGIGRFGTTYEVPLAEALVAR
jgi:imidazoleglycerol phosphate dehydratase HisB